MNTWRDKITAAAERILRRRAAAEHIEQAVLALADGRPAEARRQARAAIAVLSHEKR